MDSSPVRLAILEADTPIGSARAKYGSYGGIFTALFEQALDASKLPRETLEISGWDVVNAENEADGQEDDMGGDWHWKRRRGYPALEEVDAFLITGSRFNAFDNDPWVVRLVDFVKGILAQERVKVIGVCYGHQIIGRALGAKVDRSETGAWEVSVCQVIQTPKGKELFGGKDALSIFQMHRDLVYHYPVGVQELGSSGRCKVQGMLIPDQMMSVQGHPEFTKEIVAELLENRHKQKIFTDEIYGEAVARLGQPHDGVIVAQAFVDFLIHG